MSKQRRARRRPSDKRRKSALEQALPTLFEQWARLRESVRRLIPPARENAMAIGIAIILFLRPFVSGKTYEWSNGLCQIAIYVLFAMWVARACRQKKLPLRAPLLTACLGIFVVVSGLTLFSSVNSDETYRRFFELLSYFLMFVMAASAVRNTRAVAGIIIVVAVASVLLCGYGFHQGLYGLDQARRMVEQRTDWVTTTITGRPLTPQFMDRLRWNRIFSYFLHPNSFAGYLIVLIPISICSFIATLRPSRQQSITGRKKKRAAPYLEHDEELPPFSVVAWLVVALMQIGALVWTFSRGAWLSLLVSMFWLVIFVLWRRGRRWREATVAACLCAAVLAASQMAGGQEQDVTQQAVQQPAASSPGAPQGDLFRGQIPTVKRLVSGATWQARVTYWQGALGMTRARPLLGVGLSAFGSAYPRFMVLGGYPTQEAHNDPLQVLAETGILGFVPFAAFWLLFLTFGSRTGSSGSSVSQRWLKAGILFGIVSYLLHGFVDFDFKIAGIALNVYALCGLFIAASEEPHKTVRFGWGQGIVVLAALACATMLALRPHVADALFNGIGFSVPGIIRIWWRVYPSGRWLCYAVVAAVILGLSARVTGSRRRRATPVGRVTPMAAWCAVLIVLLIAPLGLLNLRLVTEVIIDKHGFGLNYRANQFTAAQKISRGEMVPDLLLATLFPDRSAREQVRNWQEKGADPVAMTRAKLEQIREELAIAAQIYPHPAVYHIFLGELDAWLAPFDGLPARGLDKAIASLEKAVELNPWNHYWHVLLGDAYMRRSALADGRPYARKAVKEFESALENYPNDPESWMQLGIVLRYTGQESRAETCFEQARKLREYVRH